MQNEKKMFMYKHNHCNNLGKLYLLMEDFQVLFDFKRAPAKKRRT